MYVCNCNGVTRREVDEAIAAGAQAPENVLAHHGCEPCCEVVTLSAHLAASTAH